MCERGERERATHDRTQEDAVTGDLYYSTTSESYVNRFYRGVRAAQGSVTWQLISAWARDDAGYFSLDTRREGVYGGPLVCLTDGASDSYCFTMSVATAWGPVQLADAFYGMSGSVSAPIYDPNCH